MPRRRQDSLPKKAWGPGPWQHERDQYRWIHDGLDCYIYRHSEVTGSLNGYVAVPPEHPWWGKAHNECIATPACEPDAPLDLDEMAESGIPVPRQGSRMREMMSEPRWSCAHRPESLLEVHGGVTYAGPMTLIHDDSGDTFSWGFGFDTGHAGDLCPAMDATLRLIYLAKPGGAAEWAEHQRIMNSGTFGNTYKPYAYVKAETDRLAEQLAMVRNVGWQILQANENDEIPPQDQEGCRAGHPRAVAAARFA
jgi:hypothetical protein